MTLERDANQVKSTGGEQCRNFHAEAVKRKRGHNWAPMQNRGVGCETHAALLCCTLLLQAAASRLPSNNKQLHVVLFFFFFYYYHLPLSPWSKHFPTPANFSRRVLICNSLGCFLRLRALFVTHAQFAAPRLCSRSWKPKSLPARRRHCYLILTYCSYWILCPHAPLPSGTRCRRTKMFLLFTRRLITTDCAASLHCRHCRPSPPHLSLPYPSRWLTPRRKSRKRDTSTPGRWVRASPHVLLLLLHFFIQQEVLFSFFFIKYLLVFHTVLFSSAKHFRRASTLAACRSD